MINLYLFLVDICKGRIKKNAGGGWQGSNSNTLAFDSPTASQDSYLFTQRKGGLTSFSWVDITAKVTRFFLIQGGIPIQTKKYRVYQNIEVVIGYVMYKTYGTPSDLCGCEEEARPRKLPQPLITRRNPWQMGAERSSIRHRIPKSGFWWKYSGEWEINWAKRYTGQPASASCCCSIMHLSYRGQAPSGFWSKSHQLAKEQRRRHSSRRRRRRVRAVGQSARVKKVEIVWRWGWRWGCKDNIAAVVLATNRLQSDIHWLGYGVVLGGVLFHEFNWRSRRRCQIGGGGSSAFSRCHHWEKKSLEKHGFPLILL